MPSKKRPRPKIKFFSYFGKPVAEYRGRGYLIDQSGERFYCGFALAQFGDGGVLMYCHSARPLPPVKYQGWDHFQGRTSQGLEVVVAGPLHATNVTFEGKKIEFCFIARSATIQHAQNETIRHVMYGITNFVFYPHPSMDILINNPIGKIQVRPRDGYREATERLGILKQTEVTCNFLLDVQPDIPLETYDEAISSICYLLSLSQGTKIQWVYRMAFGESQRISTYHASHITKTYSTFRVIRSTDIPAIKMFVEQAYTEIVSGKYDTQSVWNVIDACLDAKADEDYLEARGAKLVVVMEMLKELFLATPDVDVKETIIDGEIFERILPKIQDAIKEALKDDVDIERDKKHSLYQAGKLYALNRTSFRSMIKKFCSYIGLSIRKVDIELFVACRNSLVHQGRFYCSTATDEERQRCPPLPDQISEYLFLLHFLDKVLLKLVGYSGSYVDWSEFSNPKDDILE